MPELVRGWMYDVFTKRIEYPFGSTQDPRIVDFAFEHKLWVATGSGREGGRNRFWAAVYTARGPQNEQRSRARQVYTGHRWRINAVDIAPQARAGSGLAVSGDKFGEVHVWDLTTGERLHRFRGQGRSIYEVAFDRKSKRIAFGTKPFRPGVWARNHYGAPTRVLDLRQRLIQDIDRAADMELVGEQPQSGETELSIARVAGTSNFAVQRKESGQYQAAYRLSSGRNPSVFSLLRGPTLGIQKPALLGDSEGVLAVWDSSSDRLRRAFLGHDSMVTAISAAPHGGLLASASTDRTIRIWSLQDYRPTGMFDFEFENASVIRVKPATSSARAGVQVGDRIISLDGLTIRENVRPHVARTVRLPSWSIGSDGDATRNADIRVRNAARRGL